MTKERLKFEYTIFLDRTHGKDMGKLLRKVGFDVKSIYTVYPNRKHESTDDPTWISKCGSMGWIAISGDKRIETNPKNRTAVINAQCKVLILTDSNSLPEEWAAAVIVGKIKLFNTIRKNNGPFFVNISKQAYNHISKVRFPKPSNANLNNEPSQSRGNEPEPMNSPASNAEDN